jgi:hypothetical protein
MHNFRFALEGAWQVLLAGLILGAGLPTLFAVGVRSIGHGTGGSAEVDTTAQPHPAGRILGILCFAIVVLGIVLGITFIIASGLGKELSFEHIFPTIKDK